VTEGFTFFTIYDASTDTVVFSDEFLDPTSMDALILAGTLLPDTTYDYELDFSDRLNDYDSKNGSFTVQGFDLRTDGSFTTEGAETPLPAALPLFASGIGAMSLLGWRRKRKAAAIIAA
jgi:hypothetical protein